MILKLKRTPGIYLVGFMACGKTTVGKLLAKKLGWHFFDLDDDIETFAKSSIDSIFDRKGEQEFRRIETQAIRRRVRLIERGRPTVMALGGGAFVSEENYTLLASNGISIWLDCPLSLIEERIAKQSHRPLARDPERFARLYESRHDSYARADFRVEVTGDDPQPVLRRILALPIF